MNGINRRLPSHGIPLVFMILLVISTQDARSQAGGGDTYADVAPILAQRCVMCHSGSIAPLGLRLDSFESVLQGSTRGPVVIAGDPPGSELVRRLKGVSQPRMPMTGPPFLSDAEVSVFERWILAGLPGGAVAQLALPAEPVTPRPAPGEPVTYAHVAPLFATRCAKCHADNGLMGAAPEGYRLTSHESTISTDDRVRVVPGKPDASELVRRIRGQALPRMPFDGPPYLSGEEIHLIEDWVAQGARDANGKVAPNPTGAAVRLHGTLRPGWRLDDLDLMVDSHTRIDKSPESGDYVEVRGHLDETAKVRVERLRRR
jgi:mono/diheme cytochrome c family protein